MASFSPRNRLRLSVLTATHTATDFYAGAVTAILPFFVLHAQYSYTAAAGIALAATLFSSLSQPVFGHLTDKLKIRWMSVFGLLAAGIGVSLSGVVSDSYFLVWSVVAISGLGVAAYHPAAMIEVREAGGGSSGAMSWFSASGNLGVALGPSAVILVMGWFGLSGTVLLVIPAFVVGIVYVVLSRHRPTEDTSTSNTSHQEPKVPSREREDWRAFGWLTLALAMWSVAYVGTLTFIALYSMERFNSSPEFASIALSLFPAAGAVGALTGGWLADRFGRLLIVRTGYLMAVLSTVATVLAPNATVVIVTTCVLGLSLFIPYAAQITLSHSYLPNRIGVASGVTVGLSVSLGGVISPLLGTLADETSVQLVFIVIAAVVAVGFAFSFLLKTRDIRPGAPALPAPLNN